MEPVSHLIKVSLPNYLSNLPIPNSIGGWFKLGVGDWFSLIPITAVIGGIGYMSYMAFCPKARGGCGKGKPPMINPKIQKDASKVVHSFDIEDLSDKAAFCRCWQSKKFPYCDGSHNAHNEASGDNVGPLCLERKKKDK